MNDQCMNCKIRKSCSRIEPAIDGTCGHFVDESTYVKWMDGAFDPGAPEGDQTNVRLDWGESGPELINVWGEVDPQIRRARNFIDDTEDGLVFAITRMQLETVIGYAIEGIKDRASKIGLKLTDKTLEKHELYDLIHNLANLHERWDQLETEREALRKAGEHVENRDA